MFAFQCRDINSNFHVSSYDYRYDIIIIKQIMYSKIKKQKQCIEISQGTSYAFLMATIH